MDTASIASQTESVLDTLLSQSLSDPYALEGARLYGVTLNDEDGTPTPAMLSQHPDVYSLLEESPPVASFYDFIAVVTTGWAAPLNADGEVEGAPSQHAQRRRVRLVVVANRDAVASVLRFQDDPTDPIVDLGSATGSLADAIQDFVRA